MTNKTNLNAGEALHAAVAGVMRQLRAVARNAKNQFETTPEQEWSIHIHGALAECLVAKTLGKYWHGGTHERTEVCDVGDVEVRHTHLTTGGLILTDKDSDSKKYYLVVGTHPNMQVVGWEWGANVKQKFYKPAGKSYYLMPQDKLKKVGDDE